MATTPDASKFQGPGAEYKVSQDPTTGKEIVVSTGTAVDPLTKKKTSTAAVPTYFYTDSKGNFVAYVGDPDGAVKAYMADIAANGSRGTISKRLYDNGYITQKQYTSNNQSAFLSGLSKYIMDFSVDQTINMSGGQQSNFTQFFKWVNSDAGQAGAIGRKGNVTDTTTTTGLTQPVTAGNELDAFMFDQLGRKATDAEKAAYTKSLQAEEAKAATTRTTKSSTVTGPDSQATTSADKTLSGGLTQADHDRIMNGVLLPAVANMSTSELIKTNGAIAQTISKLMVVASDYALPNYTVDVARKDILGRIANGTVTASSTTTLDAETAAIKELAKAQYGNLSKQIDSGLKVSTIANGYAAQMEKTLGLEANTVLPTDPLVQKALKNQKLDGTSSGDGLLNSNDFEVMLRNDPRWAKTSGAKEEAASYANQILSSFGLVQ